MERHNRFMLQKKMNRETQLFFVTRKEQQRNIFFCKKSRKRETRRMRMLLMRFN